MTAIEAAIGSAIFNIVVDTDETASKLLEAMKQVKAGRVTFMPLNRMDVKTPKEMPPVTENCFPMLNQLQFKPSLKKAFQQVCCCCVVVLLLLLLLLYCCCVVVVVLVAAHFR